MSDDHIDRAAEIIYVEVLGLPDYSPDAVDDHNRHSYRGDCECNASDRVDARHAAEELDAAGLLASPEHDAAVAAKALREAADDMGDTDDPDAIYVDNGDADVWLRARADRIEAGESPARTKEQAGRDHGVTIGLRQAVRHLDERAAAIERGEP